MKPVDAPNRESIIAALVLAFSHSKLKDVVGSDALRSVLTGRYRDMVAGKQLDLQVVWELIHDQPGYDEEHARPAFCAVKTWEKSLGLTVVLPASMAELSATEIMAFGSHCAVPKEERQRVLQASNPSDAERRASTGPGKRSGGATRKPLAEAALALTAAAALGFAIYSVVGHLSGPGYQGVDTDEIGAILPVKSAKKLGGDLNVLLDDDAWLQKEPSAMTADLEQALTALKDNKVEVLIVQDTSGTMRASAQWVGSPARIEVRLP